MKEGLRLTEEELEYLRGIVREHLVYYEMLAGNSRCSAGNKARYEFMKGLWDKIVREEVEKEVKVK